MECQVMTEPLKQILSVRKEIQNNLESSQSDQLTVHKQCFIYPRNAYLHAYMEHIIINKLIIFILF